VKVFLADVREAPEGWVRTRTPSETIELLQTGRVQALSLDHDLGFHADGTEMTGYSVLSWLEAEISHERWPFPLPQIAIHSANPVGQERMKRAIEAIHRLHAQQVEQTE
jgi:hypothetical protein